MRPRTPEGGGVRAEGAPRATQRAARASTPALAVATAARLLESGEAAAAAHPDPEGRRRSPRDAVRDPRSAARGGRAVDAVGGGWFSYTDSRRERFPFFNAHDGAARRRGLRLSPPGIKRAGNEKVQAGERKREKKERTRKKPDLFLFPALSRPASFTRSLSCSLYLHTFIYVWKWTNV